MGDRTALALGANACQADLVRYLKRTGWSVIVCGHRTEGPGVAVADRFEQVDIADVDGVTSLARSAGAELVYSVSSDLAMPAVTAASEALGLPHFLGSELVQLLMHKARLRERLQSSGLSPVEFRVLKRPEDADGWERFPCIVKPSLSQAQRGITLVERVDQLPAAVDVALAHSRSDEAVVEELLGGIEVSANVLVSDGQVVVNEISERLVHAEPFTGIPRGHLIPVVHADATQVEEAEKLVEDIVSELGIGNGALYFQMKLTPDGPRIVEIAPRLDGCHIWRLIEEARGLDLMDLTLRRLLGEHTSPAEGIEPPDGGYELRYQQMAPGSAFRIEEFPVPADAVYHEYRYRDGEIVRPINGMLEVVGYYVRRTGAATA